MKKHLFTVTGLVLLLSACTTGKLFTTTSTGERILTCDVEFVGLPSVDKFAVEYALSLCAKDAVKKGRKLDPSQEYLLAIDTSIPKPPCGQQWDHELAKQNYHQGQLSKREYGYIVANIDLGLSVTNECLPNKKLKSDTKTLARAGAIIANVSVPFS
ncbi:hypothetical protein OE749_11870 [Aestuariibacter sp. AA17]|uniref:Lipoprotein n=1 Tax=Fluctibacter corallii TaxID=2984329 RepID=A0ABT3A9Y5_9ALTE|nr:hypothetical protein [Aestuariibacter sp. AA17]MCV2885392.1 hypothetical protein [Aestuariibacter sp. AA17]